MAAPASATTAMPAGDAAATATAAALASRASQQQQQQQVVPLQSVLKLLRQTEGELFRAEHALKLYEDMYAHLMEPNGLVRLKQLRGKPEYAQALQKYKEWPYTVAKSEYERSKALYPDMALRLQPVAERYANHLWGAAYPPEKYDIKVEYSRLQDLIRGMFTSLANHPSMENGAFFDYDYPTQDGILRRIFRLTLANDVIVGEAIPRRPAAPPPRRDRRLDPIYEREMGEYLEQDGDDDSRYGPTPAAHHHMRQPPSAAPRRSAHVAANDSATPDGYHQLQAGGANKSQSHRIPIQQSAGARAAKPRTATPPTPAPTEGDEEEYGNILPFLDTKITERDSMSCVGPRRPPPAGVPTTGRALTAAGGAGERRMNDYAEDDGEESEEAERPLIEPVAAAAPKAVRPAAANRSPFAEQQAPLDDVEFDLTQEDVHLLTTKATSSTDAARSDTRNEDGAAAAELAEILKQGDDTATSAALVDRAQAPTNVHPSSYTTDGSPLQEDGSDDAFRALPHPAAPPSPLLEVFPDPVEAAITAAAAPPPPSAPTPARSTMTTASRGGRTLTSMSRAAQPQITQFTRQRYVGSSSKSVL